MKSRFLASSILCSLALASTACRQMAPSLGVETALDAGTKLGGCATGDLLPDRPGDEIVAVSVDGRVLVVFDDGGTWRSELGGRSGGELIQCAVGDLRPDKPGNEIVAVGMKRGTEEDGGPGAAVVVWREGDGWAHEVVAEDDALLHGVCAADLDPDRPGEEALLVGFTQRAILLSFVDGAFTTRAIADLPGAGKAAVGFDGGAAVACNDGAVVHVRAGEGGAFETSVLHRAPAGAARIGAGDGTLVVAYDDGSLGLLEGGALDVIHREGAKLRGAVLADLDPDADGLEVGTGGYEAKVTRLVRTGGEWTAATVFTDDARIHHVTAGDVTPRGPGDELVSCGYSGRLVVIGAGGR